MFRPDPAEIIEQLTVDADILLVAVYWVVEVALRKADTGLLVDELKAQIGNDIGGNWIHRTPAGQQQIAGRKNFLDCRLKSGGCQPVR